MQNYVINTITLTPTSYQKSTHIYITLYNISGRENLLDPTDPLLVFHVTFSKFQQCCDYQTYCRRKTRTDITNSPVKPLGKNLWGVRHVVRPVKPLGRCLRNFKTCVTCRYRELEPTECLACGQAGETLG